MGRDVQVHLSGFGVDVTTDVLWVFCAGAVAMLLLVIALSAFRSAARDGGANSAASSKRSGPRKPPQPRPGPRRAARPSRRRARARRPAQASTPSSGPANTSGAVDVREPEGAHAYRGDVDDPGPERRYVPGEERVN